MNFPDGLFDPVWAWGAWLPYLFALGWAVRRAPWRRLADGGQLNVWLGTIVVLTLLWSLKAGVKPGLNLHLLGVTAFTLMFGRQLAIVGLSIVLAAVTFNASLRGVEAWQAWALNALVMIVFPVFIAHLILRGVERYLPAHLFIYIFVAAFFGAAACAVATGAFASLLLWLAGAYTLELLLSEYFPFYILLGFAEAWLNGAAITLMVVYYPHWVGSFDDRRYLWRKQEPRR
ncbi:MAG: energy-coupling factor ABC transporter permease [Rhodocyclaceae bacterium]|nr:energy-coupling factor ABC transporter permease [Rhodocyclaceae bacterium]